MELTSLSAVFPSSSSPAIHSSLVLNVSSISISSSQISSLFDDLSSATNLKDSMIKNKINVLMLRKNFTAMLLHVEITWFSTHSLLLPKIQLWTLSCLEHPEHSKIRFVFLPMTRSHKKHLALTLVSFCFGPGFGQPPESSIQQSGLNEAFVLL